jgi:hypothetical protein
LYAEEDVQKKADVMTVLDQLKISSGASSRNHTK